MIRLIIILAVAFVAAMIFVNQRSALSRVREQRARLISQAATLREREEAVRSQTEAAEQELARLQSELQWHRDRAHIEQTEIDSNQPNHPAESEVVIPPDPARQGGWFANAGYFYLPKLYLASTGYPLIESNRLTDEAALLFGMTAVEREAVDTAYDELWRSFRALEIERMTPVELPADWQERRETLPWPFRDPHFDGGSLEGYVSYRIPSLADEGGRLLSEFKSSLQRTLGPVRAQYLSARLDHHAEEKLDDLGSRARVITFHETRGRNGEPRLWYSLAREGLDSTTSAILFPLEPDSQTVYYARLLGVQVPIKEP